MCSSAFRNHVLTFEQVIPLLLQVYGKFPMASYQQEIRKSFDLAFESQVTQKNITRLAPGGSNSKKDSRDMSRKVPVGARLDMLTSKGVHAVAADVFCVLHSISKTETEKAAKDSLKAAAQRRLLLPGFQEETVRSLMQWMYTGSISCRDAGQLYAVMGLASKLGVDALHESCLRDLATRASTTIQDALANGVSLGNLLGHGPDPANKLLGVIFMNVFKDKAPPARLQNLVVQALAENMDMELWPDVKSVIGHEIALEVIETMIKQQQQVKSEHPDKKSVKLEGFTTLEHPSCITDSHHSTRCD